MVISMTLTAPRFWVTHNWLRIGRDTMLVADEYPPATSTARIVLVIDVGPVPVSTAVVGVVTAVESPEDFLAGAVHAMSVAPRAMARRPARARRAGIFLRRRVSSGVMATRG